MARATAELIRVLRVTANRLASDANYQWGHMGACNCGHLAQTITKRSKGEIHRSAMVREGDWRDQADYYCEASGLAIDHIIGEMLAIGLTLEDIRNLERLNDDRVLSRLPGGRRYLRKNARDDVVAYLRAWADLLDGEADDQLAAFGVA